MLQTENQSYGEESFIRSGNSILELRVRNHPGVMSHICGLFTRRAFNLEKILCLPIGDGKESKIYLTVTAPNSLDQIIKQLLKLEDVVEVYIQKSNIEVFDCIEMLLHKEIAVTSNKGIR